VTPICKKCMTTGMTAICRNHDRTDIEKPRKHLSRDTTMTPSAG